MTCFIENKDGNISEILWDLRAQLTEICPEKKRTVSAAVVATEEVLLFYMRKIEDFRASVKIRHDTKLLEVCIEVPGERFSLEEAYREDEFGILERIRKNSDLGIRCTYEGACNTVSLTVKKYFPARDNIAYALKYLGKNRNILRRAELVQLAHMIAGLFLPALTAAMIVRFTENVFIQTVTTAAVILLVTVGRSFALNIANICYNKVFYRLRTNLETDLAKNILSVREECFDEYGTGAFANRVTTDVTNISTGLGTIFDLFSESAYYVGVLIATLLVDWRIFLCELATIAILSVVEYIRSIHLDADSRSVFRAEEQHTGLLMDIINGEREIRILNGVDFFHSKMHRVAEEAGEKHEYSVVRNRTYIILGECATALCHFGILVLLGYFLKTGSNTLAMTLVLYNYFSIIGVPLIQQIQKVVEFIKTFNLSCERVRNLQEGSEFPKETYGTVHIDNVTGDIELKNVSFAYNHDQILEPDRLIIKDLNLHIRAGERVAFVGKSGSGKTTLFNLISGQRRCSEGMVLIDGADITTLDKTTLRDNMMVISQAPYFFNTSIKDNLLIAKPDATMEELERVCEMACIREEIEKTEDGYDTVLGERGIRMSGGQKQRLAIARGLLKGAKIILFDEATSAIDNITQAKIKKTLGGLGRDHTLIMIAHRLSTVIDADRIVVIDQGQIVAQGKHAELMKESTFYRELYEAEG